MSLRMKRSLPLIALLGAILAGLAFGLGSQPVSSYRVSLGSAQVTTITVLR